MGAGKRGGNLMVAKGKVQRRRLMKCEMPVREMVQLRRKQRGFAVEKRKGEEKG